MSFSLVFISINHRDILGTWIPYGYGILKVEKLNKSVFHLEKIAIVSNFDVFLGYFTWI
jgi:hypothetical protein